MLKKIAKWILREEMHKAREAVDRLTEATDLMERQRDELEQRIQRLLERMPPPPLPDKLQSEETEKLRRERADARVLQSKIEAAYKSGQDAELRVGCSSQPQLGPRGDGLTAHPTPDIVTGNSFGKLFVPDIKEAQGLSRPPRGVEFKDGLEEQLYLLYLKAIPDEDRQQLYAEGSCYGHTTSVGENNREQTVELGGMEAVRVMAWALAKRALAKIREGNASDDSLEKKLAGHSVEELLEALGSLPREKASISTPHKVDDLNTSLESQPDAQDLRDLDNGD